MKRRIKDMYKICVYHASYPHGNYTLQYAVGPFIQIPFANISSYFHSNLIFFLDTVYNSVISNFFVRDHIRNTCICHDFWLIAWKGFCASTDETCHVIPSRTKIHVKLALYNQAWQITNMSNGIEKYIFSHYF